MSNVKQTILPDEALKKLQDELQQLKTITRKEVAEKIKVALSFGDLSENSEYDEAKNEQALVESRIAQIEAMLKNVKILDEHEISNDIVSVGSKVRLFDKEFDEEVVYQIVGSTEADPMQGKISDESPVGKFLLGHKVGDVVEVETPGGICLYEVLEITK